MTGIRRHPRGTRLLSRAVLVAALSLTPAIAAGHALAATAQMQSISAQSAPAQSVPAQVISDGSSSGADAGASASGADSGASSTGTDAGTSSSGVDAGAAGAATDSGVDQGSTSSVGTTDSGVTDSNTGADGGVSAHIPDHPGIPAPGPGDPDYIPTYPGEPGHPLYPGYPIPSGDYSNDSPSDHETESVVTHPRPAAPPPAPRWCPLPAPTVLAAGITVPPVCIW